MSVSSESKVLKRMETNRVKRINRYKNLIEKDEYWHELFNITNELLINKNLIFQTDRSSASFTFRKNPLAQFDYTSASEKFDCGDEDEFRSIISLIIREIHEIQNDHIHRKSEEKKDRDKEIDQVKLKKFYFELLNHELYKTLLIEEKRLLSSIENIKSRKIKTTVREIELEFFHIQINTSATSEKSTLNLELSRNEITYLIDQLTNIIKED